jgi:hypothetical protein
LAPDDVYVHEVLIIGYEPNNILIIQSYIYGTFWGGFGVASITIDITCGIYFLRVYEIRMGNDPIKPDTMIEEYMRGVLVVVEILLLGLMMGGLG